MFFVKTQRDPPFDFVLLLGSSAESVGKHTKILARHSRENGNPVNIIP
jgi:hypothetical protein